MYLVKKTPVIDWGLHHEVSTDQDPSFALFNSTTCNKWIIQASNIWSIYTSNIYSSLQSALLAINPSGKYAWPLGGLFSIHCEFFLTWWPDNKVLHIHPFHSSHCWCWGTAAFSIYTQTVFALSLACILQNPKQFQTPNNKSIVSGLWLSVWCNPYPSSSEP